MALPNGASEGDSSAVDPLLGKIVVRINGRVGSLDAAMAEEEAEATLCTCTCGGGCFSISGIRTFGASNRRTGVSGCSKGSVITTPAMVA
jgi:hypothetical protein